MRRFLSCTDTREQIRQQIFPYNRYLERQLHHPMIAFYTPQLTASLLASKRARCTCKASYIFHASSAARIKRAMYAIVASAIPVLVVVFTNLLRHLSALRYAHVVVCANWNFCPREGLRALQAI
jgi:hypothetical protein